MASDPQVPTFDEVIGSSVRSIREKRGWSQDRVARAAWDTGLDWGRAVVAALENGGKTVDAGELVLLAIALEVPVGDLLAGDQRVRIGRAAPTLDLARAVLGGESVTKRKKRAASDFNTPDVNRVLGFAAELRRRLTDEQLAAYKAAAAATRGEAEQKAARKLGVRPEVLSAAAFDRWGRSLTDERDARVLEQVGGDANPRSVQAARGHITRRLLVELAPDLAETQEMHDRFLESGSEEA